MAEAQPHLVLVPPHHWAPLGLIGIVIGVSYCYCRGESLTWWYLIIPTGWLLGRCYRSARSLDMLNWWGVFWPQAIHRARFFGLKGLECIIYG